MIGNTKVIQKEKSLIIGGKNSCPHGTLSRLGSDGDIMYLKCNDCRAVIAYDYWNGIQCNLK